VVDHPALGVDPAYPRARVDTVQVNTGQYGGAIRINGAFWATCYVGVAKELRYALACSGSDTTRASSIVPAGRGVAGVYHFSGC
jgi:hypothetical protein